MLIEKLKIGMILAANVLDRSGRVLLRSGTELSDKDLYTIRAWGVSEVAILIDNTVVDDSTVDISYDPELLAMTEETQKPRFRYSNMDHPAVHELMRICVLRKIKNDA